MDSHLSIFIVAEDLANSSETYLASSCVSFIPSHRLKERPASFRWY